MKKQKPHPFDLTFSAVVKERLETMGRKRDRLAAQLGIGRPDLTKYINLSDGYHGWRCALMSDVAAALGISLDEVQQRSRQRGDERESHEQLYRHYRDTAVERPNRAQQLKRLYLAVRHACEAGRHQEAFAQVYWPQVSQGGQAASWRERGDVEADLATLRHFFEVPWRQPVASLSPTEKSFLLHWTGCDLRALGDFKAAGEAMQEGLKITLEGIGWVHGATIQHASEKAIQGAVLGTFNLSTLYLLQGELDEALKYAEIGVELAANSSKRFPGHLARTILNNVLWQRGREADTLAVDTLPPEEQEALEPEFQFVGYVVRFFACELLLGQHEYQRVINWAEEYLREDRYPADSALDYLTLGTAVLRQHEQAVTPASPPIPAREYLDQAVKGLARVSNRHHLPRALLTRADWHRLNGDLQGAQIDLDEAMLASLVGDMKLYQADCHLAYARLHRDGREPEKARTNLNTARALVKESHYHRLDEKIDELEREIARLDRVSPATQRPAKGSNRRK